jgi:enediyne biosynthesis protein E4
LGVNRKYLGFGVGFFDYDNDGWKDLFLANGHVYSQISGRNLHISYKEPKVLYRNLANGRFEDVSMKAGAALSELNLGRGCAFGDFDNDGDVDIVINNLNGPPSLLRNDGGNKNNWIMVKCLGTRSNRSGIGTRVKVTASGRSQIDEVMSGSSYYSQNDLRVHFGLGKAKKVDSIEISWPSGLKENLKNLAVNQLLIVQETKGIVESRKFR